MRLKNFNVNVDADTNVDGSVIALPGLCPGELKTKIVFVKHFATNYMFIHTKCKDKKGHNSAKINPI